MSKKMIREKIRDLHLAEKYGRSRVIFFALLLLWIPWGILCFPGNLPWDAGLSMAWHLGIDRTNPNNPWFQNLLMGLVYRFGQAVGVPGLGTYLFCWGQMVTEAWLLGKVIALLWEKTRAGKSAGLLVILFALPVFPIYAFMMGKDSGYALGMLGMVYLLLKSALEGGAFWREKKNIVWLAVLPAVLGLLRNMGGVIPLLVFMVLALMKMKKAGMLPAAGSALLLLILTVAVPKLAGIPEGEMKETMSMPLQTVGYYVQQNPEEVTEEEWAEIARAVDPQVLKESYDRYLVDPVKSQAEFTAENRDSFLKMWLGMLGKHPGTILEGWRRSTDLYFSMTDINPVKSHYFVGVCYDPALQEKLGIHNWDKGNYIAKGVYHVSMRIPVIRQLQLSGPWCWAAVLLTIVCLCIRRVRKFLPCCVLLMMVLGACLLGPVNGYYRYAYPLVLSCPGILAAVIAGLKRNPT